MASKKKLLGSTGVPALCSQLKSVKQTANTAAAGVQQLSDALTSSVQEIEDNMNDMIASATSVSLAVASWKQNTSLGTYQWYYDISKSGVTTKDLPVVSVAPASLDVTSACELCPTCESLSNAIRLYAKSKPSGPISINYWIIQGK